MEAEAKGGDGGRGQGFVDKRRFLHQFLYYFTIKIMDSMWSMIKLAHYPIISEHVQKSLPIIN
jgi:hypothetical protein